jgi:kelch-like protein 19
MYFLAGGYDGNDFLSSVERYDIEKKEWTEVTTMSCGRSGHGAASAIEPCLKG